MNRASYSQLCRGFLLGVLLVGLLWSPALLPCSGAQPKAATSTRAGTPGKTTPSQTPSEEGTAVGAQDTPSSSAIPTEIPFLESGGVPLDDARLGVLIGKTKATLVDEEAKDNPDPALLAFENRTLAILEGILSLYGAERAYPQRRGEVEERLLRLRAEKEAMGKPSEPKAPKPEGPESGAERDEIPLSTDRLAEIAATIAELRGKLAELEKEALRAQQAGSLLDSSARSNENLRSESEGVRQEYLGKLAKAQGVNAPPQQIADLERRIQARDLTIAYSERRSKQIEKERELLAMSDEALALERSILQAKSEAAEKMRALVSQRLEDALSQNVFESEKGLEEARKLARMAQTSHARLRANKRVEEKLIDTQRLRFKAEKRQALQGAREVLLGIEELRAELELAKTAVKHLEETRKLGRPSALRAKQVSDLLHSLRHRARRLQEARRPLLADLGGLAGRLEAGKADLQNRLRHLGASFRSHREKARSLFEQGQGQHRRRGFWGWKREVEAWKKLESDTRSTLVTFLEEIAAAENELQELTLTVEGADTALEEIKKFVRKHHRYKKTPLRISIGSLKRLPSDMLDGADGVWAFLMKMPASFSAFTAQDEVLYAMAAILVLGGLLLPALILIRRFLAWELASPDPIVLDILGPVGIFGGRVFLQISGTVFLSGWLVATSWLLPLEPATARFAQVLILSLAAAVIGSCFCRELASIPARESGASKEEKAASDSRRHLVTTLHRLLLWSLFFVPAVLLLETTQYSNHGFLDLLWLVHNTGVFALAIGFLRHRRRVIGLLSSRSGKWWKASKLVLEVLRPIMIAAGIWIFLLWVTGTREYAASRLMSVLHVFLALLIVPAATTVVLEALPRLVNRLSASAPPVSPLHAACDHSLLYTRLLVVLLAIVTALFWVLAAWGLSPRETFEILGNPLPWIDPESMRPTSYLGLFQAILSFLLSVATANYARDMLREVWLPLSAVERGLGYAISTIARYIVLLTGATIGFAYLNIRWGDLNWLFAFVGLGIGFGMQDIVTNFIAGLIMLFERPVKVGDVVGVGDTEGSVQSISIRSTLVRTRRNIDILIPNKRFITEDVINWTLGDKKVSIFIDVGVSYDTDVKIVRDLLLDIARKHGRILSNPQPSVLFMSFGDSSLDFALRVWIDRAMDRPQIESDLRFAIFAAFNRRGIEIPFPQRDLHLRSSDVSLDCPGAHKPPETSASSKTREPPKPDKPKLP